MTTEATPVAMEVWERADHTYCTLGKEAAAAVIATALADMQRRVEVLKEFAAIDLTQSGLPEDFTFMVLRARQALSDKTQENES